MSVWLRDAYPWIKSAHIVSMVAWIAGLLYLPRLFVYHAAAPIGSDKSSDRFNQSGLAGITRDRPGRTGKTKL